MDYKYELRKGLEDHIERSMISKVGQPVYNILERQEKLNFVLACLHTTLRTTQRSLIDNPAFESAESQESFAMYKLFISVTLFLLASSAYGCTCLPTNIQHAYSTADRFVKAVPAYCVAINEYQNVYFMTVSKVFKGCPIEQFIAISSTSSAACGITFQVNETYIIPLPKSVETNVVHLYSCQVGNNLRSPYWLANPLNPTIEQLLTCLHPCNVSNPKYTPLQSSLSKAEKAFLNGKENEGCFKFQFTASRS